MLFDGQESSSHAFLDAASAAPAEATPFEVVAAAAARRRRRSSPTSGRACSASARRVIDAQPGAAERELRKLAGLATALAEALRDRGVAEPAATLAAQSGSPSSRVEFEQWLDDEAERTLAEVERSVMAQLCGLATSFGG